MTSDVLASGSGRRQRRRARARCARLSPKPTDAVTSRSPSASAMYDTTSPESMPPDRNAPSGTSLSSRSWTAVRSVASMLLEQLRPSVGDRCRTRARPSTGGSRPARCAAAASAPAAACGRRDRSSPARGSSRATDSLRAPSRSMSPSQRRAGASAGSRWRNAARRRASRRRTASCPAGRARRTARGRAHVVDREREHAFQLARRSRRRIPRRRAGSLRCRTRCGSGGPSLRARPQFAMVVDLAVEDDPARAVFVGHRLVAAGAIDDRQTRDGRATAGASSKKPSPSGPRWCRAAFMAGSARRQPDREVPSTRTTPQMPHMSELARCRGKSARYSSTMRSSVKCRFNTRPPARRRSVPRAAARRRARPAPATVPHSSVPARAGRSRWSIRLQALPPTRVATTGSAAAIASRMVSEMPSVIELLTYTSNAGIK